MRSLRLADARNVVVAIATFVSTSSCDRAVAPLIDENLMAPGGALMSMSDGAHSGNKHFYLLPPLVKQPAFSGTFDATLTDHLAIDICEWNGTACTVTVAHLTSTSGGAESVRVSDGAYIANWSTNTTAVHAGKTYRVRISVIGVQLGFFDVVVLDNASQAKSVDPTQYVAVVRNATVPIKFRVETGAVTVIQPSTGGVVTTPDAPNVTLTIPPGALTDPVAITITPATGTDVPTISPDQPPLIPGTSLLIGPAGTTFQRPVTLSIHYDPATLPPPHVTENFLGLHAYDPVSGTFVLLGSGVDDPATHTFTATLTSLAGRPALSPSFSMSPGPRALHMTSTTPSPLLYIHMTPRWITYRITTPRSVVFTASSMLSTIGAYDDNGQLVPRGEWSWALDWSPAQTMAFSVVLDPDFATLQVTSIPGTVTISPHLYPVCVDCPGNLQYGQSIYYPWVRSSPTSSVTLQILQKPFHSDFSPSPFPMPCCGADRDVDVTVYDDAEQPMNAAITSAISSAPNSVSVSIVGPMRLRFHTTSTAADASITVTAKTSTPLGDFSATSVAGTVTFVITDGSINVPATTAAAHGTVDLSATLTPAAPGRAMAFSVNNHSAGSATTDANGVAHVTYSVTEAPGNYPVTASFAGDALIRAATGSSTLTITKATPTLSTSDVSATFGDNLQLTASVAPTSATGTVTFTVDGVSAGTANVSQGSAQLAYVVNVAGGAHSIGASYSGDASFSAASASANLNVAKAATQLAVTGASGQFNSTATVSAQLSPAASGRTIAFSLDGSPIGTATTDATGKSSLSVSLTGSAGDHPLTATFAGDADYLGSSGSATLTITSLTTSMSVDPATATVGQTVTFRARLSPAFSGRQIQFINPDKDFAVLGTTDATGVATANYQVAVPAADYTLLARFFGDADLTASSASTTFHVDKASTSITVPSLSGNPGASGTLTAQLSPALQGKALVFTVGATTVGTATTDATGAASIGFTLPALGGAYSIGAAFAGDMFANASTGSGTLSVTAGNATITATPVSGASGASVTLQATLLPATAGKTIAFVVNGSSVGTGTTDATGKATTSYTLTLAPGSYSYEARFAGDAQLNGVAGTAALVVDKIPTSIDVPFISVPPGTTATITATLSPSVSGRTLKFVVDGVVIGSRTTNANGTASITFTTGPSIHRYEVIVTFAGDATYAASSGGTELAAR